jgi:hypothetical protein
VPEEAIESEQVLVPIDHYSVQLGAFASRDRGFSPLQNLQFFLSPPPEHSHGSMLIQFRVEPPFLRLGHIIRAARINLTAFFPYEAFANFYSVLRAEKPIFVQYTLWESHRLEGAAEAREVRLASFHLTTSHEPVGEGPVNLSGDGEQR